MAAPLIEDDFHSVINLRGLTAGEFCLAADHTGRPNTLYRFLRPTVAQMARAEGVTEALKATDPLRWTGLMNNLRHSAEEQVLNDLIYS